MAFAEGPPVSDIFREVEEDVRREKAEKLWKAYGSYLLALAVLAILGVGAWQLWERHETQQRDAAAAQFIAAQRISNPRDAANAFADIATGPAKGYGLMARLSEANAMFVSGQQKNAVDLYKQIAISDSGPIGNAARLRAAWAQADSGTRNDLTQWLAPLNQPGNAWRENALEVLAYADYRSMDLKGAQAKYASLATDPEAPDGVRARAKAMSAFLKNGGGITFGTVPPDAVPTPPAPAAAAEAAPAK
jgi:hypothetical protein